ncbi:lipoprotein [Bergeyella porcorum]|uniref:Lipoprotein n=1 Tax=Bergeyella porcorum TaxID=1735111 RepID=A0AAU0F0U2_9FLAO
MKKYLFILLASATLGVTSCSPFQVRTDYAETANFNSYKTYKLRIDDLKLNDIDKDRVLNEVSKQLKAKGLTVGDNPDLIVNIKAQHKKITDVQSSPGMWGWGWGGPWGWGVGMNRTWTSNYTQGGLVIDLIDANTQKLVWQGIGEGISVDSPKSKQKQIPDIVASIMANYPPKK